MDSKSTWHNEAKGVTLIENYYKKLGDNKGNDDEKE